MFTTREETEGDAVVCTAFVEEEGDTSEIECLREEEIVAEDNITINKALQSASLNVLYPGAEVIKIRAFDSDPPCK